MPSKKLKSIVSDRICKLVADTRNKQLANDDLETVTDDDICDPNYTDSSDCLSTSGMDSIESTPTKSPPKNFQLKFHALTGRRKSIGPKKLFHQQSVSESEPITPKIRFPESSSHPVSIASTPLSTCPTLSSDSNHSPVTSTPKSSGNLPLSLASLESVTCASTSPITHNLIPTASALYAASFSGPPVITAPTHFASTLPLISPSASLVPNVSNSPVSSFDNTASVMSVASFSGSPVTTAVTHFASTLPVISPSASSVTSVSNSPVSSSANTVLAFSVPSFSGSSITTAFTQSAVTLPVVSPSTLPGTNLGTHVASLLSTSRSSIDNSVNDNDDINDEESNSLTTLNASWLRKLLVATNEGRCVLLFYDKNKTLDDDSKRSSLATLIITKELLEDASRIISPHRFSQIAAAIKQCFPSEEVSVWYLPYSNQKVGGKHNARGKLQDAFNRIRRGYISDGLIPGRKKRRLEDNESINNEAIDGGIKEDIQWLKNNAEHTPELIEKLKRTLPARRIIFREEGNGQPSSYFSPYPGFKSPNGYLLIDVEFGTCYPGQENRLMTLWETDFMPNVLAYAIQRSKNKRFDAKLTALKINLNEEEQDKRVLNSFLVLAALFPTVIGPKKFKPSQVEVKEAFLLHVNNASEVDQKLLDRKARLSKFGFPEQPSALLVGDVKDGNFFIVANEICYKCPSLVRVIDVCFKLFKVSDVAFPPDSKLCWTFLQKYVYGLPSDIDTDYVSLTCIASAMGLE